MLRSYVRSRPNPSVPLWSSRLFSIVTRCLQEQQTRKRGRPRKDESIAVQQAPSSSPDDQTDSVNIDGAAQTSEAGQKTQQSSTKTAKVAAVTSLTRRKRTTTTTTTTTTTPKIPPRLSASNSNHHDLASFLHYAATTNLNPSTNVYKGTLYEYTVAHTLQAYNLTLLRTGRSNDLGIDLIGHWHLPPPSSEQDALRILIQCKALAPRPAMIRELEGTYVGAPAGFRGEGTIALLVANKEATKGTSEALRRSRLPMGLMQVTGGGRLMQFVWNQAAAEAGLEGLGVALRFKAEGGEGDGDGDGKGVARRIALTWMGEVWKRGNGEDA